MEPVDIPTRLRALRLQAGISQRTAAKAAGVNPSTWTAWEHGRVHPRLHRAADIARALDAPICALTAQPDETPIADITLTAATLTRLRQGGHPAALTIAAELAARLTPTLEAAATSTASDMRSSTRAGHPSQLPRARAQQAKARIEAKQQARNQAARLRQDALASEPGGEGPNA